MSKNKKVRAAVRKGKTARKTARRHLQGNYDGVKPTEED